MSSLLNLWLSSLPALLAGLWLSVKIIFWGFILAFIIGLLLGIINVGENKILKFFAKVYIDIFRGTPLLVQIFLIYFGLPAVLHFKINAVFAGICAIGLNAGAYIAEIIRGGINSVDIGQMEAARSLGLSYRKSMWKVVLPQAMKRMIPPLVNQLIISLKDTSLLSAIGVAELTSSGQVIIATTFKAFQIWICVGLLYFIVVEILAVFSSKLEKYLT